MELTQKSEKERKSKWLIGFTTIFIILILLGSFVYFYFIIYQPRIISETSQEVFSCIESDGKDIYKKDTLTYSFKDPREPEEIQIGSIQDWCEYNHPKTDRRVGLIREGYCEENMFKKVFMTCGLGYVCRNGACVKGSKSMGICSDTDGGKDISKRGYVQGYGGSGKDDCLMYELSEEGGRSTGPDCSGDNCYVEEWYCEGDSKAYEIIPCPSGCLNGACK